MQFFGLLCKSKVLEVHEKSDLVPALVHKKKFDCVPRSNHETCMKCLNWKFTKNMIEFPFPLMRYELVREIPFIDCVLPIPCLYLLITNLHVDDGN